MKEDSWEDESLKSGASNAILIVGGGISGIQAALDLADQGYMVYLVEKSPSIGGRMAQLDKTFPTNDCAMCILAPKMVLCGRHPNIELMTYSEVVGLRGEPGSFTASILRKARYVDESRCTGCGLCAESCPIEVPNEYDEGLGFRKAIYLPFPQAYPNTYTIDREHCIECRTCERRCPAKAIDFDQTPFEAEIRVGSVILAVGYEMWDPTPLREYGYGRYPNVITSLQFERILSATGPTGGKILRPSDGSIPRKIAFIQCVGSRNVNVGVPYCSNVCCMYATKEAVIAKEHDPRIQPYIFYIDLRAAGKSFQEYVNRAQEESGVAYIKGVPSEIRRERETEDLILVYEDISEGEVRSLKVDMVVLCPAILPNPDITKLREIIRFDADRHGFIEVDSITRPVTTSRDGIFVCGVAGGPMDIPDSVSQSSGAASLASLYSSPGKVTVEESFEDLEQREARVGVFVCHCGTNIGAIVDVPEVVEHARDLSDVIHAEGLMYACSEDSLRRLKDAVKKHGLNRVVVASCTPRTHEPLFQSACVEAGLNPYLFVMANIRDQCSWVHQREPEMATEKAKDLVRMAIAKARLATPLRRGVSEVERSTLVVGGGVSGLTAASNLAEQGFEVHLIEREDVLGGLLNQHHRLYPHFDDPPKILDELVSSLQKNPRIHVYLKSTVDDVKGYIGDFDVTIRSNKEDRHLKVGTIIVATGAVPLEPHGLYGYGELQDVITQGELEERLREGSINPRRVVMIQCAGARDTDHLEYCSRICCNVAIKNSIVLRERFPDCSVHILYRDIRAVGRLSEDLYEKAREMDVKFLKFPDDKPPQVGASDGALGVRLYAVNLGREVTIECDTVVLSTPLVPPEDNGGLSKILKVPTDTYGFFLEAHTKLRPVDFSSDGIFLCGTAQGPKGVADSVSQALAAASRAAIPMRRGVVETEAIAARVDEDLCVGCETCVLWCEYGAPSIIEKGDGSRVSKVNEILCKGCGACVPACPTRAMEQSHFTTEQIFAQIEEAVSGPPSNEPKIVAFLCNWCSYAGADLAGVSRLQYPPSVRIVRLMCTGRFDIAFALKAVLLGADGVLVCGCHPGDCHYISGNFKAERRVKLAKRLLEKVGIEGERIRLEWVSAGEGRRFSEIVTQFTEEISQLRSRSTRLLEVSTE
ncbi:MAG: hydrogenase iron-sulfur subunit [Candidatus Bathyarchaeia archaeon]